MKWRILVSVAWLGGAAAAAHSIVQGVLLRLPLGEHALFAGDLREVALLGVLGPALIWGAPAAFLRGRRRGRTVGLAAAFAVILAAVSAVGLLALAVQRTPLPPVEPLAAGDRPPAGSRRTLVVGVDGMTWNRILPLVRQGRLPHLANLLRTGTRAVLASHRSRRPSNGEVGYWSPVVWTTLATGVTEDRHGIDDFGIPNRKGQRRLAKSFHRRTPAFWNLFSTFELPVGVVGWWATWPAEEIRGFMASSNLGLRGHRGIKHLAIDNHVWLKKLEHLTWPEDFVATLEGDIGLPPAQVDFLRSRLPPPEERARSPELWPDQEELAILESVLWQDELYRRIALHLLRHEELALTSVYLEGIDVLSHHFYRFLGDPRAPATARRIADDYYAVVDRILGELMAAAGEQTTVLVVSDHGFAAAPAHPEGADHSPDGVLIARGEGIRRGAATNQSLAGSLTGLRRGPVSVLDFLPTVLYLHGLPVAPELAGRLLHELFEPAYLKAHPLYTVAGYGDFEATRTVEIQAADESVEEEYEQRLRALGYLD